MLCTHFFNKLLLCLYGGEGFSKFSPHLVLRVIRSHASLPTFPYSDFHLISPFSSPYSKWSIDFSARKRSIKSQFWLTCMDTCCSMISLWGPIYILWTRWACGRYNIIVITVNDGKANAFSIRRKKHSQIPVGVLKRFHGARLLWINYNHNYNIWFGYWIDQNNDSKSDK